jgi:hypothetical protein
MKYLILGAMLVSLQSCSPSPQNIPTIDPVTFVDDSVQITPGSKFMNQLQVVPVGVAPGGERKLRTVGQMAAIANASGELLGKTISWVTLDPALILSLGLNLSDKAPVGFAYGVTSISKNYRDEIHPGEKVEIYRYGLRQNSTVGSVISVKAASNNEDSVIFSINRGEDWYPGTNCQVEFPLVQKQAVALSPLSMLHEGLREFVMKETGPGLYTPEEITVVNETRDQVYAIGNLSPGDRIIESGAILLKPLIHQILERQPHVR